MRYRLITAMLAMWGLSGPASAVELSELDGSPVSSMQQLEGKVLLVDFWASWCTPCRKSFPWLNSMQQRHGGDGLHTVE